MYTFFFAVVIKVILNDQVLSKNKEKMFFFKYFC